jgi:8-oxo-dGTP pyrophosphatase MutT (NUDIX family)
LTAPHPLAGVLEQYEPRSEQEAIDVERVRELAAAADPWTRSSPLHVTGSALIVCPDSGRVLLRWHVRQQAWLQVGGHADAGETDPFEVALREAREETGLPDLAAWPDPSHPSVIQIVVVPVSAGKGEPAHEHADMRYILSTARPEAATPEGSTAPLRWLSVHEALDLVTEDNLRVCLTRLAALLQPGQAPPRQT